MAKDPAFLFYPNDWDGGTKLFTREQKGAYMDLLICQFHSGHMTGHDIAHILGQIDYKNMWENKLKQKFKQDDDGNFYNEKLENEQVKRKKWCESRRNNHEGHNQYSGHMTTHMSGHMVNVNVNDNVIINKEGGIGGNGVPNREELFDSIWARYPKRDGRKAALRSFLSSVKTKEDWDSLNTALDNYLQADTVLKGFVKNGSTWFNNWKDWVVNENV